ncbi:hypothetical protein JAAARDRAFT_137326 [Jaapia argillacea MUCL 33604]|uniref:Uncharacterized protein n=1 Tax=Jaapia argillacea MUCL 33604 TaxID=933084 RepID=A0A067PQ32_9AGAM|nr:hypothetical protein JAAARDRAFT_137326 [Jaapia argillacea MUCL 33604]
MHLIWENLIKNLIALWTGEFKGLDQGWEQYELATAVWEGVGSATMQTGSTVPYVFSPRLPDIAINKSQCTADAWSFWTQYIAPVLLCRKFKQPKYYTHFVELVKLIRLCLRFELNMDDITTIREGFIEWVTTYERFYYQSHPSRLPACPVTIHTLLHIADSIEASGPVWVSWAFPMERYCGYLQPAIKSRCFPYACIDQHVLNLARLAHIKLVYNLKQELSLKPPCTADLRRGEFSNPLYPSSVLMPPRRVMPIESGLFSMIVRALVTVYNTTPSKIRPHLDTTKVEQWGKVRRLFGGDVMNASSLVAIGGDRRDVSYYEAAIDTNAAKRNVAPRFVLKTFFGQPQNIFVVRLPPSQALKLKELTTHFLAAIRSCTMDENNTDLDIHYYSRFGKIDVIDLACVQCLVGRVPDDMVGHRWGIIDWSGPLARALYVEDLTLERMG